MIQQPLIKWLPLLAASLFLVACAGTGTHNNATSAKASQDMLKQRADQRWDALINKHAEKAYDYLTPGYRATISRDVYADRMNNRPVRWKAAKVRKVECQRAQKCTVYVSVTFTAPMPGLAGGGAAGFSPQREDWLFLGNQWYYLPREEGGNNLKAAK